MAGLIQHLTSLYSSPLVVMLKKSGGVRITVNYKKLNKISRFSQLPIPRVDQVLDSLGTVSYTHLTLPTILLV